MTEYYSQKHRMFSHRSIEAKGGLVSFGPYHKEWIAKNWELYEVAHSCGREVPTGKWWVTTRNKFDQRKAVFWGDDE